jgi:hypothetical protein
MQEEPMRTGRFPRSGFLMLGVASLAAGVVFVIRAAMVEATAERIAAAIAFGVMGVLWLTAYGLGDQGGPK